jgi:hypothetical protein
MEMHGTDIKLFINGIEIGIAKSFTLTSDPINTPCMKTYEEVLASNIPLAYDMRVEFAPPRPDASHRAMEILCKYFLKRADGSSEQAGEHYVTLEFMQHVPDDVAKNFFQQNANRFIDDLSR